MKNRRKIKKYFGSVTGVFLLTAHNSTAEVRLLLEFNKRCQNFLKNPDHNISETGQSIDAETCVDKWDADYG